MPPATGLFIVLLLVAANGFFVATEFALVSSRSTRIDQLAAAGNRAAASPVPHCASTAARMSASFGFPVAVRGKSASGHKNQERIR